MVRGGFLWQTLEGYPISDDIAIFLTALILFTSQLIKQVKQIWFVHVIQGFGGGRGERRTTTSTGSGHYSSHVVQPQYLRTHLVSQQQICDKGCKIIRITASQKQKDSDVGVEVPLGTAMGWFQPHPTMPCWDPKDSTSTSRFLTMLSVPFLLGLCGTYVCLTAADHIRILVCTLSYHWLAQTRVSYEVKSGYSELSQEDWQFYWKS